MSKMIFVNLPVTNLKASIAFYKALGFEPHFSNDTTAYMVWHETVNAMLLTQDRWLTITSRPTPPATSSEVMLALPCNSRDAVDAMNKAAGAHGGKADAKPTQDMGFMYNCNLLDPDGHVWEATWMDPSARASGDQTG